MNDKENNDDLQEQKDSPSGMDAYAQKQEIGNSSYGPGQIPKPSDFASERTGGARPMTAAESAAALGAGLTYGEKAVGIKFNHATGAAGASVDGVKGGYARIIDLLKNEMDQTTDGEKKAQLTIAIRNAQTAQMWAVKAITWGS